MIGRMLCHQQIETTARYAHLVRDSVSESAKRVGIDDALHCLRVADDSTKDPSCSLLANPEKEDDDTRDAELSIARVHSLPDDIDIPESLAAIGAKEEYIDRTAHQAAASTTLAANPVSADAEDMKSIYLELM